MTRPVGQVESCARTVCARIPRLLFGCMITGEWSGWAKHPGADMCTATASRSSLSRRLKQCMCDRGVSADTADATVTWTYLLPRGGRGESVTSVSVAMATSPRLQLHVFVYLFSAGLKSRQRLFGRKSLCA